MRKVAIFSAVTAASVAFSGVAHASQSEMQDGVQTPTEMTAEGQMDGEAGTEAKAQADMKAKVVEKGAKGRARTVMLNGKSYAVCGGDVTDGCINPREAGLNYGNRALDYWPGKPASEM